MPLSTSAQNFRCSRILARSSFRIARFLSRFSIIRCFLVRVLIFVWTSLVSLLHALRHLASCLIRTRNILSVFLISLYSSDPLHSIYSQYACSSASHSFSYSMYCFVFSSSLSSRGSNQSHPDPYFQVLSTGTAQNRNRSRSITTATKTPRAAHLNLFIRFFRSKQFPAAVKILVINFFLGASFTGSTLSPSGTLAIKINLCTCMPCVSGAVFDQRLKI